MLPLLHSRIVKLGYKREATGPRKTQKRKAKTKTKTRLKAKTGAREIKRNGAIQSLAVGFPEHAQVTGVLKQRPQSSFQVFKASSVALQPDRPPNSRDA